MLLCDPKPSTALHFQLKLGVSSHKLDTAGSPCLHSRVLLCALVITLQLHCPSSHLHEPTSVLALILCPHFPAQEDPSPCFELVPSFSVHLNLTTTETFHDPIILFCLTASPPQQTSLHTTLSALVKT